MFPAVLSSEYWSLCCLLSLTLEQCSLHSPGAPCSRTVLPVVLSCPWSQKRVMSCSELTPALKQCSPLFSGWKMCFQLSPSSERYLLILTPSQRRLAHEFPKIFHCQPMSAGPWVMRDCQRWLTHQLWNWWLIIGCRRLHQARHGQADLSPVVVSPHQHHMHRLRMLQEARHDKGCTVVTPRTSRSYWLRLLSLMHFIGWHYQLVQRHVRRMVRALFRIHYFW